MIYDSGPRIDPVLNLARDQMQHVTNIHLVHLAIVSGRDETRLLEFEESSLERMLNDAIPSLIAEIAALGVILSSPARIDGRYGATVMLIDRTLEAFYVPIVRLTNADTLIGDFRTIDVSDAVRYTRIHAELGTNWLTHDD
jgi:hypothetical protein